MNKKLKQKAEKKLGCLEQKWNTENEIIRRRGAYGLQTKNEKEKKFHRAIKEKWNKSEEKVTRLLLLLLLLLLIIVVKI